MKKLIFLLSIFCAVSVFAQIPVTDPATSKNGMHYDRKSIVGVITQVPSPVNQIFIITDTSTHALPAPSGNAGLGISRAQMDSIIKAAADAAVAKYAAAHPQAPSAPNGGVPNKNNGFVLDTARLLENCGCGSGQSMVVAVPHSYSIAHQLPPQGYKLSKWGVSNLGDTTNHWYVIVCSKPNMQIQMYQNAYDYTDNSDISVDPYFLGYYDRLYSSYPSYYSNFGIGIGFGWGYYNCSTRNYYNYSNNYNCGNLNRATFTSHYGCRQ